jgi:hypothetical protein
VAAQCQACLEGLRRVQDLAKEVAPLEQVQIFHRCVCVEAWGEVT